MFAAIWRFPLDVLVPWAALSAVYMWRLAVLFEDVRRRADRRRRRTAE